MSRFTDTSVFVTNSISSIVTSTFNLLAEYIMYAELLISKCCHDLHMALEIIHQISEFRITEQ